MQKQVTFDEAKNTKYPEQVVIAVAKDREGKVNPISVSWTMIVSHDPPMMAIAIGKTRYSAQTIPHSECFTIVYPSIEMKDQVILFGTESGRDVDKIGLCVCPTESAKEIDSVLLLEAVANFECQLESYMPAGDHIVFVGRIVASHINTEPRQRLYVTGPDYQMAAVKERDI